MDTMAATVLSHYVLRRSVPSQGMAMHKNFCVLTALLCIIAALRVIVHLILMNHGTCEEQCAAVAHFHCCPDGCKSIARSQLLTSWLCRTAPALLMACRASVSADSDAGKRMVAAVVRDPGLSLVDALLAQHEWAGTLGDDDVRALREYDAERHALDVEWRADRVYSAAFNRRIAAKRRRTQGCIHFTTARWPFACCGQITLMTSDAPVVMGRVVCWKALQSTPSDALDTACGCRSSAARRSSGPARSSPRHH